MTNLFTRIAGLVLAFGFFFGCSVLNKSSNKQTTDSSSALSETQIKKQVSDLEEKLDSTPENTSLLLQKGSLLTKWAQKKDDPQKRTSLYFKADQSLSMADSLAVIADNNSNREEISQLRKVAWSNEHNQGVQSFQNASSEKDYNRAAIYFKNATAIMPDSATSYQMASKAFYKSNQPQKAIAELERARTEVDPLSVELLETLAFLYMETNQPKSAVPIYQEAQSMTNHNMGIKHGLANAYIKAGKHAKAIEILRQLAAQSPDNIIYRQSLAAEFYYLGQQKVSALLSKAESQKTITEADLSAIDSLFQEAQNLYSFMLDNRPDNMTVLEESARFYHNAAVHYQNLLPHLKQQQKDHISDDISKYLSSSIPMLEQLVKKKSQQAHWESLYQAYRYLGMTKKAQNAKAKF